MKLSQRSYMGAIFCAVFLLPSTQAQDNSTPGKPARQVTAVTNETPTQRSVTRFSRPTATPAPQPAAQLQNVSSPSAAEDLARKSAEIVFLQKQIKEKQRHIELLMQLFVADERQFMLSLTDAPPDPTVQARVRQEQEELRAESAICARLQARLAALTVTTSNQ